MLIYHPAFDAYHCIFRMIAVSETVRDLEVEKARLLDFYLLFPASITSIRIPPRFSSIRKSASEATNVYHDPINPLTTFQEMRFIQEAALKCIAAAKLIDVGRFEDGFVTRTREAMPPLIKQKVEDFLKLRQPITDFVLRDLAEIPLYGNNGLKHRTELMEHKYDVV